MSQSYCQHPTSELTYRTYSNGSIHFVRQCLTCGEALGNAIPYANIPDDQKAQLPAFDPKRREIYEAERKAALTAELEQARKQFAASPQLIALPSIYRNTTFRSRLEARWAYYFDLLKINWQYEPEGYDLPHGRYCPDFLCNDNFYVEIKPAEAELAKVKDKLLYLALGSKKEVYGIVGPPSLNLQWMASSEGSTSDDQCPHAVFSAYAFLHKKWGCPYLTDDAIDLTDDDEIEWQMARALRFENGRAIVR